MVKGNLYANNGLPLTFSYKPFYINNLIIFDRYQAEYIVITKYPIGLVTTKIYVEFVK